jgi:hypothetical protein
MRAQQTATVIIRRQVRMSRSSAVLEEYVAEDWRNVRRISMHLHNLGRALRVFQASSSESPHWLDQANITSMKQGSARVTTNARILDSQTWEVLAPASTIVKMHTFNAEPAAATLVSVVEAETSVKQSGLSILRAWPMTVHLVRLL